MEKPFSNTLAPVLVHQAIMIIQEFVKNAGQAVLNVLVVQIPGVLNAFMDIS
jgi:hypothetical protein